MQTLTGGVSHPDSYRRHLSQTLTGLIQTLMGDVSSPHLREAPHPDSHRRRLRLSCKTSPANTHGRRLIQTLTGGGISSRLIQTRAHCTAVQPPHYCNNTATTPLQQPFNATTTPLPGWGARAARKVKTTCRYQYIYIYIYI